ncbi:hypothetical protein [Enteractinococcus helveticum]|nr:hypothetical protein [Enteractinococcus helveticum]
MRFPARVGVAITAGLLACGAVPAAHAATTSSTAQPPAGEAQQETQSSSLKMSCQLSVDSAEVTITFSPEVPFDELTVSVDDQAVAPQEIHDNSVVLEPPESGGTATLELWENESLTGECDKTIPPATTEPTPSESPEPSDTADPTPTESDSAPPSTSPTPKPTTPTSPTTTPTEETPTKSSTLTPSSSSPSATSSDSPRSTRPTARPRNRPQGSAQRPHAPVQQQPEHIGPRIIRQFSNDPRYLLHQLLGIPGQTRSELIMPRPRNDDQGPPDLETLPPVSEDELEAIKARLTAPHRADQPSGNHVATADEQASNQTSTWLWLLSSFIVVAVLGGVTFWLLKRRQHNL